MSPEFHYDRQGNKYYELTKGDIIRVIDYTRTHDAEPEGIKKVLSIAMQYKKAGLTPMFLTNEDETFIKITTKELFGKKLH